MIESTESTATALSRWEEATLTFLRDRRWHPRGATLLLAVSGGADSVALLRFWARRGPAEFGCKLHVVHVDHRLRPGSAADAEFVATLAAGLGIPVHLHVLDPATRVPRESMEMWARRERYRCFAAAAQKSKADFVLTGHHRDDVVETVFQRLARGTGPRGLAGIPFLRALHGDPKHHGFRSRGPAGGPLAKAPAAPEDPAAGNPGPALVRPLLARTRADILEYLRLTGSLWREDESNADTRIDRNAYRILHLPRLRRETPDLDARVFALAQRMQSLIPAIDRLEETAGLLRRDAEDRAYLPAAALQARVTDCDEEGLQYWLKRLLGQSFPGSVGLVTKEILREFLRQWKDSAELQVQVTASAQAGPLALRLRNGRIYCEALRLEPRKRAWEEKKKCLPPEQRIILNSGAASFSWRWDDRDFRLSARSYPRPRRLVFPRSGEGRALFDADLFSCTLVVRTRRDGDRFSPYGVSSKSRKLKAFLNEEKIPTAIRDEIPIVLARGAPSGAAPDNETLAWVPGHGTSEFFKVSGATTRILELVLEKI